MSACLIYLICLGTDSLETHPPRLSPSTVFHTAFNASMWGRKQGGEYPHGGGRWHFSNHEVFSFFPFMREEVVMAGTYTPLNSSMLHVGMGGQKETSPLGKRGYEQLHSCSKV